MTPPTVEEVIYGVYAVVCPTTVSKTTVLGGYGHYGGPVYVAANLISLSSTSSADGVTGLGRVLV